MHIQRFSSQYGAISAHCVVMATSSATNHYSSPQAVWAIEKVALHITDRIQQDFLSAHQSCHSVPADTLNIWDNILIWIIGHNLIKLW